MGLLDFDNEKVLAQRRVPARGRYYRDGFKPEDNFTELQLLDTKVQSEDFSDSPFADRRPL